MSEEKQGKGKEESKAKGIKDKYVVIDVKNRGRKNYVTTVTGLNNFGTSLFYLHTLIYSIVLWRKWNKNYHKDNKTEHLRT